MNEASVVQFPVEGLDIGQLAKMREAFGRRYETLPKGVITYREGCEPPDTAYGTSLLNRR